MKTMKHDLNDEIIKHMIYTVYTHWERLLPQLLRRRKSIKVLIISRFDDHHAKSMIDFLDFYCTDNFEFTQMIKYNLTVDDIEASDADVVVANFMMPELKKKPLSVQVVSHRLSWLKNSMPSFMILPVQNTKDKAFLETFLR